MNNQKFKKKNKKMYKLNNKIQIKIRLILLRNKNWKYKMFKMYKYYKKNKKLIIQISKKNKNQMKNYKIIKNKIKIKINN